MTDVKVEQCDVDLAARIAKDFGFDVSHSDWLAPKLACHRQAAEKATRERDAGIVKTHPMRVSGMPEQYVRNGLATAIRSQNDG